MSFLQGQAGMIPAILAAVVAFAFLIVVHELGHALAARAVGMKIVRFSVGYGKVLWSFRLGETQIALSAIPVGGYCWIGGMIPEDGVDPASPQAWLNQHAWRRTLAIAAGPVASYLGAIFVAALLFVTVGLRVPVPGSFVGDVIPASPAAQAGLATGDHVVSIGGQAVGSWEDMLAGIQRAPGRTVEVVVERSGERVTLSLTPRDERGVGKAGFSQLSRTERRPVGAALAEAFHQTNLAMVAQGRGILRAFSGKASTSELSGPLDIGRTLAKGAQLGPERFFTLIWILSVALAVLNLVPLPPLDGGKLVFLLWELGTGRRASQRIEAAVSWVGFILLAALMLGVTLFGDIPRLLR
ncbi:MAG TPA: site-2 protease family protein [Anaeromyxobacteraceae bacterium]|nr:site-2 protease family protein [Anaeromyxobacteraceae bacterium]